MAIAPPGPEQVQADDLKDAGQVLLAVVAAAVPASVGVGIALFWLRLHDARMSPLVVVAGIPKERLALEGSQLLVYVVGSTVLALVLMIGMALGRIDQRRLAAYALALIGLVLVATAVLIDQDVVRAGGSLGGRIEEPGRLWAAAGGGFFLAGILVFPTVRRHNWRLSVAVGIIYVVLATALAFGYLALATQRLRHSSVGPHAVVLLTNARPEGKGKPRQRLAGRLVYVSGDAVAVCVDCERYFHDQRILVVPRKRVVWVRVDSKDVTPPRRELKPTG